MKTKKEAVMPFEALNEISKKWLRPILELGYRPQMETIDAFRDGVRLGAAWQKEQDADKWVSVEDETPKVDKKGIIEVLCLTSDGQRIALCFVEHEYNPGNFYMDYKNHFDIYTEIVTHWMPLPNPPKQ